MRLMRDGKRGRGMSDLIKRSDAIEAIEIVDWYHQNRNKDMVSGANSDEHQAWYKADDVYKALEAVPSADRPQGEWIFTNNTLRVCDEWECDQCGNISFEKTNFCDRCGADMRGERDE